MSLTWWRSKILTCIPHTRLHKDYIFVVFRTTMSYFRTIWTKVEKCTANDLMMPLICMFKFKLKVPIKAICGFQTRTCTTPLSINVSSVLFYRDLRFWISYSVQCKNEIFSNLNWSNTIFKINRKTRAWKDEHFIGHHVGKKRSATRPL